MPLVQQKKSRIQFRVDDDSSSRRHSGHSTSPSFLGRDTDEDDDAVDFLGGARGAIPSAPVDDLSGLPPFVPGWSFQANNPGRDLQSCRDFVMHVTPPVIEKKMSSLNARQSINRGIKATFDSLMWSANTLRVADRLEVLARKLRIDLKNEQAKAAKEREQFEKFKADHSSDIAKVDQLKSEVEALKAQLAEQAKKTAEMETSLQQNGEELNAAVLQRDEALVVKDRMVTERDQALFERDAAVEEKKKLQAGLPDLIITSMGCPGILNPFGRLVQCARGHGRHETATLAAQFLDPLPEVLASRIDLNISSKLEEAKTTLKNLSTSPFLEKLVEDLDMPVDAILAMRP